ncbi:MAG TPA: DNA gyrase subunit A [Longimicrobiales bacterium]|nr:DNA gyrase subunit A [Longimicrobiales bacterium]
MDTPETPELTHRVLPRLIEQEMRDSFLDYSMSVIVQRALPDVRDGLKPVHRRILYAMADLGLGPTRPYKKSANVVGEVLGKYHPHGDSAVYDAMVRMVQDFSLRYPLVDGQGNFGSIDGDNAAAYRYTEARLEAIAGELLADIDKETVAFTRTFDDQRDEPVVLPSRLPNLLINGAAGIAVGMATNIPPHNLGEIVAATVHLIDHPDASVADLMEHVQGPDFPTAGYIHGRDGIRAAYETGRGRLIMRANAVIEEDDDGSGRIIVDEIPYMVNKSRMIEQIAGLVREKKITDIRDLRDESDRDGMRVVIELKRDAIPHIVLNQLFKHTQMQSTFGVIMLALDHGVPKVMNLPTLLKHFVAHRHEVVVRRSEHDLREAREREHILQGLKVAVDNIDRVIEMIRAASDTEQAREALMAEFALSERQARAILDMRLARLTGLEIEKLEEEIAQVLASIEDLEDILGNESRRYRIIKDELGELSTKYGDERRTRIVGETSDLSIEDLIPDEPMVVTISHTGYVKRLPLDTYRTQRRGGRGLMGMNTKEEDWVEHLFLANTHDYLMVFTRRGHCYWLKVHQIPSSSRAARGKPLVNLLQLGPDEAVAAVVPVREFSEDLDLTFATRRGVVKKTALSAYRHIRVVGINAINIDEGDELIDAQITSGGDEVVLATHRGMAIRFREGDVRQMGRAARGVRGIRLAGSEDYVVGMVVVRKDHAPESAPTILVVTERGMGKRTEIGDYRLQGRGGKGVINIRTTEKTGKVVAIKGVHPTDELVMITRNGVVNRQGVSEIRVIGRNTQGVRLIMLDQGDEVMDVARLVPEDNEEGAVEVPAGSEPGAADAAGAELADLAELEPGEAGAEDGE